MASLSIDIDPDHRLPPWRGGRIAGTAAVVHLFSVQLPLDAPSRSWVILSALLVLTVAMGASLSSLVIGAWIGKRRRAA